MTISRSLTLAQELLKLPSVTPADHGCQELIKQYLQPLSFSCTTINSNTTTNLWAIRGTARPIFCFAGHTDVVPTGPHESWLANPFVPTIHQNALYGRGAADMKGSIAAFLVATQDFITNHPQHQGSIAILLTSDEEGPATDGTVKVVEMLKKQHVTLDYCLIGEPTSAERLGDTVKNGRRGSLTGKLVIYGHQGHVAYPQLAENPIHRSAAAIHELGHFTWDEGNRYFPATTWQISNIHAGTGAANVIPGTLELIFNFRYATCSTLSSLQTQLENILQRHQLRYELTWLGHSKPYLSEAGAFSKLLSETIHSVTGFTPELSTTGGTSDGRFLSEICSQTLEFGPVNKTIHQLNEHIPVADLEKLQAIYYQTLCRTLAH